MKKFIILFVFFISCIHAFGQLGYRVGSRFIELYPDSSSLYFVQTKDADQMNRLQKDAKNNQSNNVKVIANLSDNACVVNSKSFGDGHYVSDIYKNRQGHKIIILPRIAIKMKEGYEIEDVLTKFSNTITFDKKKVNLYLVDCQADNAEEVLYLNNKISTQEGVEWCEPMMIGEAQKLNDLEGLQFYLKNVDQYGNPAGVDINVEPAWDLVTVDTTLVVAIIDDGVERNHEDLADSVVDGYTIGYPNEKGEPINEFENTYFTIYLNNTSYEELCSDPKAHGTACAGIIGARNNNIGIRGIASGVRILPINIHPQSYPIESIQYPTSYYESVGDAITWAYSIGNADIISCSMWFEDNTYISNALNNAMNNGRNGKGTVVVCASGRNPYHVVNFPANMPNTIAVGSVDNTGNYYYYSGRGTTLDLVAPSVDTNGSGIVVTTDRSAPQGYNTSGDYMYNFGESSAACPQVSGVVALMLSYNPNLTVNDVRTILHNTAHKLPGMNGLDRTDDYGYGLVDAYAAIMAIIKSSISISGPSTICCPSSGTYLISNLPLSCTVVWNINNSDFNITTSGNQCLVTYTGSQGYCIANLTAYVYYQGTFVKQLTKLIRTGTPNLDDLVFYNHYGEGNWIEGNAGNVAMVAGGSIPYYDQYECNIYRINNQFQEELVRHALNYIPSFELSTAYEGWYTVYIRGINDCGYSVWSSGEIECEVPEDRSGSQCLIVFNSDSYYLSVKWNKEAIQQSSATQKNATQRNYEVQIWNETKLVKSFFSNQQETIVSLTDLPNGFYIAKVIKDGKNYVKKFTIKK